MRMNGKQRSGALTGRALTFAAGLVAGVAITVAGSALGQNQSRGAGVASGIFYAIATLSVDTEENAIKIEELEARIDDLEARLPKK